MSIKTVKLYARAKITLSLDILRRMDNGYHEINAVMQQINLGDTIKILEKKENKIQIVSNSNDIPLDQRNLVWKAIDLLRSQYKIKQGVDVQIEKRIPIEGGLAGGSADAACALIGINNLWKLGLTKNELINLGSKIGYDVCFCVVGGTAQVKGKGEIVTPISTKFRLPIVIANPGFGISTKYAYQALDLNTIGLNNTSDKMKRAVEAMDLDSVIQNLYNDFENLLLPKFPIIEELKKNMLSKGALGVLLSGSGSSIFGVMSSISHAHKVAKILKDEGFFAWWGWSCPSV